MRKIDKGKGGNTCSPFSDDSQFMARNYKENGPLPVVAAV